MISDKRPSYPLSQQNTNSEMFSNEKLVARRKQGIQAPSGSVLCLLGCVGAYTDVDPVSAYIVSGASDFVERGIIVNSDKALWRPDALASIA